MTLTSLTSQLQQVNNIIAF